MDKFNMCAYFRVVPLFLPSDLIQLDLIMKPSVSFTVCYNKTSNSFDYQTMLKLLCH